MSFHRVIYTIREALKECKKALHFVVQFGVDMAVAQGVLETRGPLQPMKLQRGVKV